MIFFIHFIAPGFSLAAVISFGESNFPNFQIFSATEGQEI